MSGALRSAAGVATLLSVAATLAGCSNDEARALGESVEVEFHDGQSQLVGPGTVTVIDVREGSTGELEDAGYTLDEDQRAATAFFVDVAFTNDGDTPVAPGSPGGEDPDGNLIPALTVIELGDGGDSFESCPGIPEEVPAGEKVEGCSILLVPKDTEMERIYFHPGGSEEFVYWATE